MNTENTRITPDEIPMLTASAMEVVKLFKLHVKTIPTSVPALLLSIPSLIAFFKASKPLLEVLLREIKD